MEWSVLWDYRFQLLDGLKTTVLLSAFAIVLSFCLGALAGIYRVSRNRLFRKIAIGYTEVLRNVPLVVKFFFLYFAVGLSPVVACLLGLALHQSAYIGDVVRSGILAVPRTQVEAAQSLGLSTWIVARQIILPQAVQIAMPALTNQFVEIVKNTSVAMAITVVELTFVTQTIQQETFRGFEAATAVTLLYAGLAALVVIGMRLIESKACYDVGH
jgi:polar amino acid transport system permease protein